MKHLICVVGPTAVGKSAVALSLAQQLNTDLISADSRQVYREMSIGTAKPSEADLGKVLHHFVGTASIHDRFTAGQFAEEAFTFLQSYFEKHESIVICGGTGLYFSALLEGINRDSVSEPIREEVNLLLKNQGLDKLIGRLKSLDPALAGQIELANPRRVTRALEWVLAGKPEKAPSPLPNSWKVTWIGLELPRDQLYQRINIRVDQMVESGLVEEARALFPFRYLNALQTVGYQELFQHFEGEISLANAIELIKQHTRNYAKRQITWFKRNPEIRWFSPNDQAAIGAFCFSQGIGTG